MQPRFTGFGNAGCRNSLFSKVIEMLCAVELLSGKPLQWHSSPPHQPCPETQWLWAHQTQLRPLHLKACSAPGSAAASACHVTCRLCAFNSKCCKFADKQSVHVFVKQGLCSKLPTLVQHSSCWGFFGRHTSAGKVTLVFSAKPYASHPWPQAFAGQGQPWGLTCSGWPSRTTGALPNFAAARYHSRWSWGCWAHGKDDGKVAGHDGATAYA